MNSYNPISDHMQGRKTPKFIVSYFITEEHSNKHPILPHAHRDMLELYFIESGYSRYMVNNHYYDLKSGDIVICNQNTLHGEIPQYNRCVRSYSIGLKDVNFEYLSENRLCGDSEHPVISTGALAPQIKELFHMIHVLSADPKHLSETCNTLCWTILLYTYELILSRKRKQLRNPISATYAISERIRLYLDEHYSENPSLTEISETLNINKFYIAHIFKDDFGMSPVHYMLNRRIGESELLLMSTNITISELANVLGFNSVSHFSTTFSKHVGISPERFRKVFCKVACA